MLERLILAVYIGKKMLGAFWQIEYCLKVDNLGARLRNVGKRLRKELQIL